MVRKDTVTAFYSLVRSIHDNAENKETLVGAFMDGQMRLIL